MNQEYDRRLSLAVEAKLAKPNSKRTGDYWGPFDCDLCGKKNKGYTFADSPRKFMCNSASCEAYKDNGGVSMADLLGFTFDLEREYKNDPDKIWKSYLQSRGLNKVLKGLTIAKHWKDIRGTGRGGIMFDAGKNVVGEQVHVGRIYRPIDANKSHTSKKVTGCILKHPSGKHDYDEPIHLAEGPFDMLSLEELGLNSIAVISTTQNPKAIAHHLKPYKKIVLCFDFDETGINCTRRYLQHYPDAEVMLMDRDIGDWNDFLRSGPFEQVKARIKANRQRYINNGRLALAKSAYEYGNLYHELFNRTGLFTFNGATWFSEIRTQGQNDPTAKTERIGLFTFEVLCFIDIAGGAENQEYLYKLKIQPIRAKPIECVASYRDLSTARDFNAFLLRTCKCTFEGKANAMSAILVRITSTKAPIARQAKYLGLDHDSGWWVSRDWCVDNKGGFHQPDKNGLFKVDHNHMLMAAENAKSKTIVSPSSASKHSVKQIYELIEQAYPVVGPIAFAWYIGSLFVNELKDRLGFYPYLSISGPADCGKSSFVEILQLLQGWDSEGRDLSNSSSDKGLSRELYGASGMFRAFLEVTEDTEKILARFINILAAYNRGGGAIKAAFSNNNAVNESNLYCALLFCQNVEVWANKQQKTRVISLRFNEENLTMQTKASYEKLLAVPKEDKASVAVEILKRRQIFESSFQKEYEIALDDFNLVTPGRVKNNHCLLLAISRIFCKEFRIECNIHRDFEEIAIEKEYSSKELSCNAASTFFEMLQLSQEPQLSKYWVEINDQTNYDHGCIFFSLFELYRLLQNQGFPVPKESEVQKALKLHPSYISNGQNYNFPSLEDQSTFEKRTVRKKAWKLDAKKLQETENISLLPAGE